MKMRLLASALLVFSFSSIAVAAPEISAAPPLELPNHVTQKMTRLTPDDWANTEKVRAYVAPVDGGNDLYQAYVNNGYLPFHAMLLTNWDVTQGMRLLSPNIPENPPLVEARINNLKNSYRPAH